MVPFIPIGPSARGAVRFGALFSHVLPTPVGKLGVPQRAGEITGSVPEMVPSSMFCVSEKGDFVPDFIGMNGDEIDWLVVKHKHHNIWLIYG